MTDLNNLQTPAAVVDRARLERNAARMRENLQLQGVAFRMHVKTLKSVEATRLAIDRDTGPIAVSTLAEAEHFFQHGFSDIVYAVGVAPGKLERIASLTRRGCVLRVILDDPSAANALRKFCESHDVRIGALIEIDSDGQRAGVAPTSSILLEIAQALILPRGSLLDGVLTHAGFSYASSTADEIRSWARREREGLACAADRLRGAGFACPIVSAGSTPTALFGGDAAGATEIRAGVHVCMDLVMLGLGVCEIDDIALSVLTTVIGRQPQRGRLIVDAGWMALSRDRGTARQRVDCGYGVVCDLRGTPIDDLIVIDTNQEHGLVARRGGGAAEVERFPIGTMLRILPNHACATAAQHTGYHVADGHGRVAAQWQRVQGW